MVPPSRSPACDPTWQRAQPIAPPSQGTHPESPSDQEWLQSTAHNCPIMVSSQWYHPAGEHSLQPHSTRGDYRTNSSTRTWNIARSSAWRGSPPSGSTWMHSPASSPTQPKSPASRNPCSLRAYAIDFSNGDPDRRPHPSTAARSWLVKVFFLPQQICKVWESRLLKYIDVSARNEGAWRIKKTWYKPKKQVKPQ